MKQTFKRQLLSLANKTRSEIPSSLSSPGDTGAVLCSCNDLSSLRQAHCRLIVDGGELDTSTVTHLINSYSSFQRCHSARSVFDSVKDPPVILYNSMIRAYTRSKLYRSALKMYRYMVNQRSLQPDKYTFTFVLKACTGDLNLQEGILIHDEIFNTELERDVFIGTGLIDMYSKLGDLRSARHAFDKIRERDVAVWNAMIAGVSQGGDDPLEALGLFKRMQDDGIQPNSISLLNVFPAVSNLMDLVFCRCIHGYALRRGFHGAVMNGLIDMYSKCGCVGGGRRIFDQMRSRDDVSWGSMMAGYVHNGCFDEVLNLFDQMKVENLNMNTVSAASAFLAAAEIRDLEKGREIHEYATGQGTDSDVSVATPCITMYAKCGEIGKAKLLFEKLPERDLISWTALTAALVQSGHPAEALSLFREMQKQNLRPNRVTLMSVLPACAELSHLALGKSVHSYAVKAHVDTDISTGTALVSMYAKCGCFSPAIVIFDSMPHKDIVTWNALIDGYTQNAEPERAISMFRRLLASGVQADAGTMVGVVSACALSKDHGGGSCVHGRILKIGFESDSCVRNSLIDMYGKCGRLSSAESLFSDTTFAKDEVSWNTLITGYLQSERAKEAISAFHEMRLQNFRPNLVTIISILPAAASLTNLREGMAVHACSTCMGFQSHTLVGNSLIDMYAKCGKLDCSERIFNEMENKDTVSWNAMLAAYAMHGQGHLAVELFSLMQKRDFHVDSVSFINILSACRHAGLVEEGRKVFLSMKNQHNLEPSLEHYSCMVDLLSRAGLFDETLKLIKSIPMEADAAVWGALLGACNMYSNVELGELAVHHLAKLEPSNPAHYVVLSSIYSESGRWADARGTRFKLKEIGLMKTPGCSWDGGQKEERYSLGS